MADEALLGLAVCSQHPLIEHYQGAATESSVWPDKVLRDGQTVVRVAGGSVDLAE